MIQPRGGGRRRVNDGTIKAATVSSTNDNSNNSNNTKNSGGINIKTVDEQSHQLLQMLNQSSNNKPQPQDNNNMIANASKKPRIDNTTTTTSEDNDNNDIGVDDHHHDFDLPNDNAYCEMDLAHGYEQQHHTAKEEGAEVPNTTGNNDEDGVFGENVGGEEGVCSGNEEGEPRLSQEDDKQEVDVDEPDWDAIALHEPSKTDAPVFLSARDRKDEADERFAQALDECHASLNEAVDGILGAAVEIYNVQREKLEVLELELKQHFVYNEEARATMQRRLEESANAAQGLFAQLLQRVSQPIVNANIAFSASAAQMMLLQNTAITSSSSSTNAISNNNNKAEHNVDVAAVSSSFRDNRKGVNNHSTRPTTSSSPFSRNVAARKEKTNQTAR